VRLLLIEDDRETAEAVITALNAAGHAVEHVADGAEGLGRMVASAFDVAIVDRMLPGMDGLTVVGAMRVRGIRVPVLMLTALGSVSDRVAGLQGGADDYLVKPFSMAELKARVEALGRRIVPDSTLVLEDLVLDRLERTARRGDRRIDLMPREFQLLELLMINSPAVVTRSMLLEKVWNFRFDPGTNLVESHISRLRGKVDRGSDAPLIHTVRLEGYAARAR
jgi:two-component system OmpR family response regulator